MNLKKMHIRPVVSVQDAAEIATIYNHYINHSIATFEEEPMSVEAMADRIDRIQQTHPYLVGEVDGVLVAYAYATQLKARSAYRYSVETSVYLREDYQGMGYGSQLYSALKVALQAAGFKRLIGGISLPNPASVRLHESMGYTYVGTFPKVGWKFGKWIDVGYWQLDLD